MTPAQFSIIAEIQKGAARLGRLRRSDLPRRGDEAMTEPKELRLWRWMITDELTKRRRMTSYRMTEAQARERFGADAVKVEGSLEVREGGGSSTSDFMRR